MVKVRSSTLRHFAGSLAVWGAVLVAVGAGLNASGKPGTQNPSGAVQSPPANRLPSALRFRPLEYYDDRCSRCHGPFGSFFGSEFGKGLDDARLREVIREMAAGPAAAPLGDADLAVVTAFHRSLIDGSPFVTWGLTRDGTLGGEVTAGATVEVIFGKSVLKAKVSGDDWLVNAPAGWDPRQTTVIARMKGRDTRLLLRTANYSHHTPSPGKPGSSAPVAE